MGGARVSSLGFAFNLSPFMVSHVERTGLAGLVALTKASKSLKRIGLRIPVTDTGDKFCVVKMKVRTSLIEWLNNGLGVIGKLESAGFHACHETWFWEGENGGLLSAKKLKPYALDYKRV